MVRVRNYDKIKFVRWGSFEVTYVFLLLFNTQCNIEFWIQSKFVWDCPFQIEFWKKNRLICHLFFLCILFSSFFMPFSFYFLHVEVSRNGGTPSYHPFRTMGFSLTKTNHFGLFLWFSYGFPMVWGTPFKRLKGLIYHMEPNSLGNAVPLSCPCFRFFKRRGYFLCAPESSLAVSTKWPERTITVCI